MIKTPITLQDLRRKLYVKAKAEPQWRFWGLYVHVCKMETLRAAYEMAKSNEGAAGSDGVTFEAIEARGVEGFLEQIQSELQRPLLCTAAAPTAGDTERGRQGSHSVDTQHPGPRGTGGAEANYGAGL